MRKIILRDVAQAVGVHTATVSRALRGDPQIGLETTREIRRIADEMGYVPDAMLTALSAYRSRIKKPTYRATIAWVTNNFKPHEWGEHATFQQYFLGARARAAQLGYQLEEFWLREPGLTAKRANSVLRSRGINGLLLAPQPKPKMRVRLDWEHFSTVALGYTTAQPRVDTVTTHHFHSMITLVRRIRAYGYRRVGLALDHRNDARSNHSWTGAYLAQQQFWPVESRIPILSMEGLDLAHVAEWMKSYRPDAVISYTSLKRDLETLGYKIPQDVGFAAYARNATQDDPMIAGSDENATLTGLAAVDLLVGMIQRGERGVPQVPRSLLVETSWREGKTLRLQNRLGASPESE